MMAKDSKTGVVGSTISMIFLLTIGLLYAAFTPNINPFETCKFS